MMVGCELGPCRRGFGRCSHLGARSIGYRGLAGTGLSVFVRRDGRSWLCFLAFSRKYTVTHGVRQSS
jgi:hypothetical protein